MLHQRSFLVLMSFALALAAAGPRAAELAAAAPAPLLLILDASGSMWGQIEGENKIVIARRVLAGLVDGLDDGAEVGVIAYGHRREGDCDDIETVVTMGPLDKAAVKSTVSGLEPKGKTPITRSVETAFDSLAARPGGATVILVCDGLETCGGDPCAAVRAAKERGIDFRLHVIGFDVAGEDVSQLECAAQAGDGLFLSAENAAELAGALDRAVALAPAVPAGRLSVRAVADGELQDAASTVRLTSGTYEVAVHSVEISGRPSASLGEVTIQPGGSAAVDHDWQSGTLEIGAARGGELVDATLGIVSIATGEAAAQGRTYTSASSNPKTFILLPGDYRVTVQEIRGERRTIEVKVVSGQSVQHMVDPSGGG